MELLTEFSEYIASVFEYETLKMIHIAAIIAFMGNIIITGWWKAMADKTGNPQVIAFAQRQVTLTDWIFTFGGTVVLLTAAFGMVAHMGSPVMETIFEQVWLSWGFWLFALSGVIWVVILIPVQIKQARMAHEFAKTNQIPPFYWTLGRIWLFFGILATVIPMANIYWMVSKV